MKFYMAGRFSKRHILQNWQDDLITNGHEITSRWSLRESDHKIPQELSKQASDSERRRFALEDLEDIDACDTVISLMEQPRGNGRGGRHVEFGYAIAKRKGLIIVGPRETVFHHLPGVIRCEYWERALDFIKEFC